MLKSRLMVIRATRLQIRERNVALILDAAERVFATAGYKGSSISMIAEETGVPKSTIPYYFQSKEALYRSVIGDIFSLWLKASDRMDSSDDPALALESYIHDKMDLARERPFASKVWANEIIHGGQVIQDYLEGPLREWLETRVQILQRWMDQGLIHQMDPKTILYMIWATTQHYADFQHQIVTLNDNKELSDQQWNEAKKAVTSIILNGLGLVQK